jgi:hypothetical protein
MSQEGGKISRILGEAALKLAVTDAERESRGGPLGDSRLKGAAPPPMCRRNHAG